jgi:hypothetical protein
LTDDQVWELKGGNTGFVFKTIFGLGAVGAYLFLTRRYQELLRFEITGRTLLTSNLVFLSSALLYQRIYNFSTGNYGRLRLHQSATYQRSLLNYGFMLENKKKPKVH